MPRVKKYKNKKSNQDLRSTSYNFVLYPESNKKNWVELMNSSGYSWCYIVHSKDRNDDGSLKKPHIHGIIYFGRGIKKSISQFQNMLDELVVNDHAPRPERTGRIENSVQYLIHKNDKLKYQYSADDIQSFNGFDVDKYLSDKYDVDDIIKEILDFAKENKVFSLAVIREAAENRSNCKSWLHVINQKTYSLKTQLQDLNANFHKTLQLENERYEKEFAKLEKQERLDKLAKLNELSKITNLIISKKKNAENDKRIKNNKPKFDVETGEILDNPNWFKVKPNGSKRISWVTKNSIFAKNETNLVSKIKFEDETL